MYCKYFACLSGCLFFQQTAILPWTDRAQILCETSHDPGEGLLMLRITKNCLQKLLIFGKCSIIVTYNRHVTMIPQSALPVQWWEFYVIPDVLIISIKNEKLLNSNNIRSKANFCKAPLGYRRFQIGCVFAEYDLFKR